MSQQKQQQKQQQQQQEWIIVGKPKRKQIKKQQKLSPPKNKKTQIMWQPGKSLYLADQQGKKQDVEEFVGSGEFKANWKLVRERLVEKYGERLGKMEIHVECLGLGDFVKYAKPHYQYLFLKHLLIPVCQSLTPLPLSLNTYDPIFTPQHNQHLQSLSLPLSLAGSTTKPNNMPIQSPHNLIILYMPHCERFLHERYCQCYREGRVLVIGNSVKEYCRRCQMIQEQVPASFQGRELGEEVRVKDYKECFNDTYCYYI